MKFWEKVSLQQDGIKRIGLILMTGGTTNIQIAEASHVNLLFPKVFEKDKACHMQCFRQNKMKSIICGFQDKILHKMTKFILDIQCLET